MIPLPSQRELTPDAKMPRLTSFRDWPQGVVTTGPRYGSCNL